MKRGNKLLAFMFIGMFVVSVLAGVVSAQFLFADDPQPAAGGGFLQSSFYQTVKSYVAPDIGVGEFSSWIIGIISLLILSAIIWDVFMLIPAFSDRTMKIITGGLIVIMIMFKANVYVASYAFSLGISIFGFAGSLAVIIIIVLGLIILGSIFFGSSTIVGWLKSIRTNRENMEKINDAEDKAGDINALARMGEKVNKGK